MSVSPSDAPLPMSPDSNPQLRERLSDLRDRLFASSEKQQMDALKELETLEEAGSEVLMDFLSKRHSDSPTYLDGTAYQILAERAGEPVQAFLRQTFPDGLVALPSSRNIDYRDLQLLLVQRKYEEADRLTLYKMCELAGETAIQRKWIYFSEVNAFPVLDLQTIDHLWQVYSEGKFGFSVQREIWLGVGQNWDRFWPKIGWKSGNAWTRYPGEFVWNTSAPRGHLPLTNQLRGVRMMESLMKHPAWS